MPRIVLAAAALAAFSMSTVSAEAASFLTAPSSTATMGTDSSADVSFTSPTAGLSNLSFVLDGFRSLDGQNMFEDDFTLSLNGAAILSGTFNLGGGGNDVVFFAPTGASIDNISGNGTAITWVGGQVNIATPLNLAAGVNTLTFAYASLGGADAGFQGTGDESWGTHDILISTPGAPVVAGDIPEPLTWALMVTGFGGMGAALRRRRFAFAAAPAHQADAT
jgi:hypothetical protein